MSSIPDPASSSRPAPVSAPAASPIEQVGFASKSATSASGPIASSPTRRSQPLSMVGLCSFVWRCMESASSALIWLAACAVSCHRFYCNACVHFGKAAHNLRKFSDSLVGLHLSYYRSLLYSLCQQCHPIIGMSWFCQISGASPKDLCENRAQSSSKQLALGMCLSGSVCVAGANAAASAIALQMWSTLQSCSMP